MGQIEVADMTDFDLDTNKYEAIVLSVAHNEFKQLKLKTKDNVVFDIKSILDETDGRL